MVVMKQVLLGSLRCLYGILYKEKYKLKDPDFCWIYNKNLKVYSRIDLSNRYRYIIGVVLGYGWGCIDSLIPIMMYIKSVHNDIGLVMMITCDNAGMQKSIDKERWESVLRFSDAVLLNNEVEHAPFRGIKRSIKKTIKKEIYFNSLEENLKDISFNAFLVCDEFEEKSCAYWLKDKYPTIRSCGVHLNSYVDIEEDYKNDFVQRNMHYDFYCIPNYQSIDTIPLRYIDNFVVTGSPRTDYWYTEQIKKEATEERAKLFDSNKKLISLLFPNLYYPERFDEHMRREMFEALSRLDHNRYTILLKFHPRNDKSTVNAFIKEYIPQYLNYIIVDYDNTKLAYISDKVIIVGMTDSRPDIAVARKKFIEFYTKPLEEAFYKIYPVPGKDKNIRNFWIERNMSVFVDTASKLVDSINEQTEPTDETDYKTLFPEERNASRIIAEYLITGKWSDEVYRYSQKHD